MGDFLSTVEWSRAQFALTAIYHFMFVPLTLGLSFIVAIMNTFYYRTNDPYWKSATRFWMTLFAINFAIGVATGLIMEFEFGTNWSNYSWFVGDIFGAPLAAEGILAFFMESTFIAVMYFGWERVSRRFHLISTWLVAIGSNLSAFWILVANGWMQYPTGMKFNPDTMRNEMVNFFDVALSPVAVSKFIHTISAGYIVGALFVMGISAWFLLRGRHAIIAKRSFVVAASFGVIASVLVIGIGDESAYEVAQKQPVKMAATQALFKGEAGAPIRMGIPTLGKTAGDGQDEFIFAVPVPGFLSLLANRDTSSFVPGIDDLVYGNRAQGIEPAADRITRGRIAINALKEYSNAKNAGYTAIAEEQLALFNANVKDMGYGYLNAPEDIVPPVALTYYTFHIMVGLGFWFLLLFIAALFISTRKDIAKCKPILWASLLSIPLGYIAAQAGWVVAEVGRQPWAIQDLMPVTIAATKISAGHVKLSFTLFAVLFTLLLIAEIRIMLRQISIGPKGDE